MKIKPHRSVTQIIYRGKNKRFVLGWIGMFHDSGIIEDGIPKRYKSTIDGTHWTRVWAGYNGAITQLLTRYGLCTITGGDRVLPVPQTFIKEWKPIDYCEFY